jgi:phage-related protein
VRRIKFGEIDFATEEMFVFSEGAYSAPVRDVSRESVLGRNGDIIVDNGRYKNTTARFAVHIREDVDRNIERLKYLLYSQKGYQRLYDSEVKDFYRMACFYDGFEFIGQDRRNVFITFDCKPMKYSIAGDEWVDVPVAGGTGNKTIYNPFFEEARPLLYISGATDGVIVVNETAVRITGNRGRLYIDSDTRQAYYQTTEGGKMYNGNKEVNTTDFFLSPGENIVYADEGIVAKIKPRWCTI